MGLSDAGLRHLGQITTLTHLDLTSETWDGPGDAVSMITGTGIACLKHLSLRECLFVDDQCLSHLQQMPLRYLDLSRLDNITNEGLFLLRNSSPPDPHFELFR